MILISDFVPSRMTVESFFPAGYETLDAVRRVKKRCKTEGCDGKLGPLADYCGNCIRARKFQAKGDLTEADSVYFIMATGQDLVKIGVSNNVRKRLSALQTMSPSPLILVGVISGGRELEQLLHERLSHARCHGEWFDLKDDKVLQMLEYVISGRAQHMLRNLKSGYSTINKERATRRKSQVAKSLTG